MEKKLNKSERRSIAEEAILEIIKRFTTPFNSITSKEILYRLRKEYNLSYTSRGFRFIIKSLVRNGHNIIGIANGNLRGYRFCGSTHELFCVKQEIDSCINGYNIRKDLIVSNFNNKDEGLLGE